MSHGTYLITFAIINHQKDYESLEFPQKRSAIIRILVSLTIVLQGDIFHRRGMLTGRFSEECIPHQVQDHFCQQPSLLRDSEKGCLCCWSSFHRCHWHDL